MDDVEQRPRGIKRPKMSEQGDSKDDDPITNDSISQCQIDEECSSIDRTGDFPYSDLVLQCQGAEARLYRATFLGKPVMVKERFTKAYRHPTLDEQLRRERLRSEIRCMARCRAAGIAVPPLYFVDPAKCRLVVGYVEDAVTVREYIIRVHRDHESMDDCQRLLFPLADAIGKLLSVLHSNNVIHGDLTTSNMMIKLSQPEEEHQRRLVLIDFGLSYIEQLPEDKGVDLYVLEKAFLSTHPNTEAVFERILASYGNHYTTGGGGRKALAKLAEVRLRGRKREMIG